MDKELGDWFIDALSTLLDFARNNNIKKVALHTQESAALVPGKSFITSTYYNAAKRLGFGKEVIEYVPGESAPFYVREARIKKGIERRLDIIGGGLSGIIDELGYVP